MIGRRLSGFVRFLRTMGFKTSQSHLLNACKAALVVGLERESLKEALRCTLCGNEWEWSLFDQFFDMYFRPMKAPYPKEVEGKKGDRKKEELEGAGGNERFKEKAHFTTHWEVDAQVLELAAGLGFSPFSGLVKKEIQSFSGAEVQMAQMAIKNMIAPMRVQKTRRFEKGNGRLDLRPIMKDAMKNLGWPLKLFYRIKKKRLRRLVIVADVSGSMQRFNSLVIPFLLGLRGIGSKAEVFVFSTRPRRVTELIRHLSLDKALERLVQETPDWSGGTRIGESLYWIQREYGKRLFTKRAVVLIISDGWDLGAKPMLVREIKALREKVYKILWLNPIGGDPKLAIMSQAVKLCMPYIHHHISAASLKEIGRVALLLGRVMANGSSGFRL